MVPHIGHQIYILTNHPKEPCKHSPKHGSVGFRVFLWELFRKRSLQGSSLGVAQVTCMSYRMENQMEKKMENEMETSMYRVIV